jgi:hypothetical protein
MTVLVANEWLQTIGFLLVIVIEVAIVVGKDLSIFCASDSFVHTPFSIC